MALYTAFNCAIDATTGVMAGTSYTSGPKCAIQLATLSTNKIRVVEWGGSVSGTSAAAPSIFTLAQAASASTMSTAHSTATITPVGDDQTACPLTMSTTACGYGNGAITTTTTDKQFAGAQVGVMSQYEKQFPLGRDFLCMPSKFLQFRINTAATYTIICYITFELWS